jgi:hypothetical protein
VFLVIVEILFWEMVLVLVTQMGEEIIVPLVPLIIIVQLASYALLVIMVIA